jgi:hypothetical protein
MNMILNRQERQERQERQGRQGRQEFNLKFERIFLITVGVSSIAAIIQNFLGDRKLGVLGVLGG